MKLIWQFSGSDSEDKKLAYVIFPGLRVCGCEMPALLQQRPGTRKRKANAAGFPKFSEI